MSVFHSYSLTCDQTTSSTARLPIPAHAPKPFLSSALFIGSPLSGYNECHVPPLLLRLCLFAAAFVFFAGAFAGARQAGSHHGGKYKAPPPSARIEITVLRKADGKPIQNAAVIFHPIEGDRDKGGLELKSDEDGKAIIDVIPIGDTVRLQIIANGYQTYGQDFKVDKAAHLDGDPVASPGPAILHLQQHGSGSSGQPSNPPSNDQPKPPAH